MQPNLSGTGLCNREDSTLVYAIPSDLLRNKCCHLVHVELNFRLAVTQSWSLGAVPQMEHRGKKKHLHAIILLLTIFARMTLSAFWHLLSKKAQNKVKVAQACWYLHRLDTKEELWIKTKFVQSSSIQTQRKSSSSQVLLLEWIPHWYTCMCPFCDTYA